MRYDVTGPSGHLLQADGAAARTASSGKNVKDLLHVAIGASCRSDCCRSDARSDRARTSPTSDARRASSRSGGGACRLVEEPCQGCNVHGLWSRQVPLAAGSRVWISWSSQPFPSGSRTRQMSSKNDLAGHAHNAWVLHGVVEGAAGIVENFAHVDAAGEKLSRATSMSYTVRTGGSIEPGWAEVIPLPKMIDAPEPGGVNCIARKSSLAKSISKRNPSFS